MIKLKYIFFIFFLCCFQFLTAQKEDYVWVFGSSAADDPQDTVWGVSKLDFNEDPPQFYYEPLATIDFGETNTSICDANGNLLMYSNGMRVYNKIDQIMLRGDTIGFDTVWQNKYTEDDDRALGKNEDDQMFFIPKIDIEDEYYIFYNTTIFDPVLEPPPLNGIINYNLNYANISFENNNLGEIITKDNVFFQDQFSISGMSLCKHGNGRDWWLIKAGKDHSFYYIFLIDPTGIKHISSTKIENNFPNAVGQSTFSPDGSYFVRWGGINLLENGSYLAIYNFDRCSGLLSEPMIDNDFPAQNGISLGMAVSSESRFIYIANIRNIYQYDTWASDIFDSRILIGTYDEHRTINDVCKSYFGNMKLAPDNKIYISHGFGCGRAMHVIEKPNEVGLDCDLRQHVLTTPTSYRNTMPSLPNFRLGPIDTSACDTLGIDNNPVAKFRYVQDSMNHLRMEFVDLSYFRPEEWSWNFGDSNSGDDQYPTHTYASNGVYEVCLTVSNENSSDTSCRNLQVGTSSLDGSKPLFDIKLFPNPVSEILLVNVTDYLPEEARFSLYNLEGQLLFQNKIQYGWNSLDVSNVPSGVVIYEISERNKLIQSGKVIKL